ncbi:MAG TPA: transposase [Trebonia sp.]
MTLRRLNRNHAEVKVPKAGWVRFRWSRPVPPGVKSYRVTRLKARETSRRKDWAEKASTDLARRFDVIRIEALNIPYITRSARGTVTEPGRNVAAKAGLNRGIQRSGWGLLVRRLEDKAPVRVEKVSPAFTSQRCSACGHTAAESRESQAPSAAWPAISPATPM